MTASSLAFPVAWRSRRRLPARVEAIRDLRGSVERCAQHAGLDGDALGLFVVACVEAFTNVVRHGRGRPAGAPIELLISAERDALVVELVHAGEAFDAPQRTPPVELAHYPEGGLGLFIMQAAADRVEHEHAGGLNTVRLTHWPAPRHA
ncbi:ATP-binding protein [Azohydromonas lata]|uniref:ATP-binding protein n=1 Tax=Azohydromonas lata TaxID=45677 RepID=UPI0009FC113D|nr:ATP-binding protein [Azohydromonas lata]